MVIEILLIGVHIADASCAGLIQLGCGVFTPEDCVLNESKEIGRDRQRNNVEDHRGPR